MEASPLDRPTKKIKLDLESASQAEQLSESKQHLSNNRVDRVKRKTQLVDPQVALSAPQQYQGGLNSGGEIWKTGDLALGLVTVSGRPSLAVFRTVDFQYPDSKKPGIASIPRSSSASLNLEFRGIAVTLATHPSLPSWQIWNVQKQQYERIEYWIAADNIEKLGTKNHLQKMPTSLAIPLNSRTVALDPTLASLSSKSGGVTPFPVHQLSAAFDQLKNAARTQKDKLPKCSRVQPRFPYKDSSSE
jgi:hypothetical protein